MASTSKEKDKRIIAIKSKLGAFNKPFFLFSFFLTEGDRGENLPSGSLSITEKEEMAEEEECDYVAGYCKLNYLNLRTVIMAKGVKIEQRESQTNEPQ